MTIQQVDYPRTPLAQRKKGSGNRERAAWVFMRVSGVLLIVLVFVHLFSNLVVGKGVHQIDFQFVVAQKYSFSFWIIWDALMLILALIHGANGMRTIINDYVHRPGTRQALITTLWIAVVVEIVLGLVAIITLGVNPCIHGAGSATVCAA